MISNLISRQYVWTYVRLKIGCSFWTFTYMWDGYMVPYANGLQLQVVGSERITTAKLQPKKTNKKKEQTEFWSSNSTHTHLQHFSFPFSVASMHGTSFFACFPMEFVHIMYEHTIVMPKTTKFRRICDRGRATNAINNK